MPGPILNYISPPGCNYLDEDIILVSDTRLTPIDRIRKMLEQTLLLAYMNTITNCHFESSPLKGYRDFILEQMTTVPDEYASIIEGKRIINSLMFDDPKVWPTIGEIDNLLYMPSNEYIDIEAYQIVFNPKVLSAFLHPFIFTMNGSKADHDAWNEDKSEFLRPVMVVPHFPMHKKTNNPSKAFSWEDTSTEIRDSHLYVDLEICDVFRRFDPTRITEDDNAYGTFWHRYFWCFDWSGKKLETLIAVMAGHSQCSYDMKGRCDVADLCRTIMFGHLFGSNKSCGYHHNHIVSFIRLIGKLNQADNLQVDINLMSTICSETGTGSHLVEMYFLKSATGTTAAEVAAFQESIFSDLRFTIGVEANTEDVIEEKDDESDSGPSEEGSSGSPDSNSDNSTNPDDKDVPGDNPDQAGSEESPTDDNRDAEGGVVESDTNLPDEVSGPMNFLIELASGQVTLGDHLFRNAVAERIQELLDSPPAELSAESLFSLKQWRSAWLYIASVQTTKDFLSRFSFQFV